MIHGNFEKIPKDKAGIQMENYCATGEWKRMICSHFTHLFCFDEKHESDL